MEQTTQDVIQLCQPCIEAAKSFGLMEWLGIAVLGLIALAGLLTKQNLFSFAKGGFGFIKKIVELVSKKK